ncbi:MAG: hypothetical protein M1816_001997 [Peltula sp. TS41687]|nr:MAG: hypothetical protein M1816_001997 [Peltula sp. TS41687]
MSTQPVSAPFAPQNPQEVKELLQTLEANSKRTGGKKAFSCKKSTFAIPGESNYSVVSWKFNDWDYKRRDLPTSARGLFTLRPAQGNPEIVVRGYDKFFNIDEVHKTSWEVIERDTKPPYELTCKENGCIIFISGLPDDSLLVCSKHSTGVRQDMDVSHAAVGAQWLDRQLKSLNKTRSDLARELRRRNVTAVAELCDDSFEEHILAYDKDNAGLYLHGINLNLPDFATYPGSLVQEFAEQWGFRKTEYLMKDDVADVRSFLEDVGKTGSWHGRDVEGFVIRCQARDGPTGSYHDWFFKYKYEEPYLMYRQWREVTKAIISGKAPKYKKHKKITEEYLLYARRQLSLHPSLGKEFAKNHGIISMRDGFLKEKGVRGVEITRDEYEDTGKGVSDVSKDVVLVTVATLGCGKTTVAIALQKLFGWGHVQNDNIQGSKNRGNRFASEVFHSLGANPVVIADKNNHQKRERKQIIQDVQRMLPGARFVALHYVHEKEGVKKHEYHDAIRSITRDRVLSRGDNHQTIQAGSKSQEEIIGIMEGFLHRFEPVGPHEPPDDAFEAVIDLDTTASSRENLEKAVSKLHELFPKLVEDQPTASQLDEAIETALHSYKPDVKHDVGFSKSNNKAHGKPKHNNKHANNNSNKNENKPAVVEYFCISVPTDPLLETLSNLFSSQPTTTARFYRHLVQSRRIQSSFHVTLIHRANSTTSPDIWQHYSSLHQSAPSNNNNHHDGDSHASAAFDSPLGTCRVQLERVLWNDRVMCIVVRLLDSQEKGYAITNKVAHITLGTANPHIKPKESNDLLAAWLEKGSGEESGIGEMPIETKIVLDGTVKAVKAR